MKKYGTRLSEENCHHLAKTVNDINTYYTETLPTEREHEIILQSIPSKAFCVVVHKRYARKTPSTKVNGHKEFIFDCTVLGNGAVPLEMPTATETGGTIPKPMTNSLFKDDAICQYAYKGKKHIVSQLISIACNTTSLNTTYDSSDDGYDTTAISLLLLDQQRVGDDDNNEAN
jgi:hypothetical protein